MSNEKDIIEDAVVKSVIDEFAERSKIGIEKYGTTLEANNTDDFLQHLKEELMDATLYIQKLQTKFNSIKNSGGIVPCGLVKININEDNWIKDLDFFNSTTFEDD